MNRRFLLISGGVAIAAIGVGGILAYKSLNKKPEIGFDPSPEWVEKAHKLIASSAIIDTHAHPGRGFVKDAQNDTLPWIMRVLLSKTFEGKSVIDMNNTGMTAVAFAGVSDINVMGAKKTGGLYSAREFKPEEAWKSYQIQINNTKAALKENAVDIALSSSDIKSPSNPSKVKAILTMEGGDFLEGKLERLSHAYNDGLRSITIVHYRINEFGDIQTEPEKHKGLTDFGLEAIKEMQRLGFIIDLAHASEATANKALDNLSAPVMFSHTHINGGPGGNFPRFISNELAQKVAKAGGIIGAWPTGMGITTLKGFVDRVFELRDKIGPDAIAIGTDMDANYKPVVTKFVDLILVVSELLKRGMSEEEVKKFMGGNFLRVFEKVEAARKA